LEPLAHLPNPTSALELQLSVGVLTELAPHEHPNLLGLNLNAGQAIKLRLRTNQYDGFRVYSDIRRVLCHELAHNVWSDHDNNVRFTQSTDDPSSYLPAPKFKELNSKLNREVAEFERRVRDGAHTLAGAEDVYEPVPGLEAAEVQAHVLGGSGPASSSDESVEERRRRVLDAAMNRLREEEQEIEDSCGTAPANQSH